jgi:OmpA-OmpF porin, OOP family
MAFYSFQQIKGLNIMRKTIPALFIFVAFLFPFVLSSCAHISTQVPVDSDNDGVFDNYDYRYDLHFITPQYYDKCPTSTPIGVKVDKYGCPLDTDKDGVPDYLDKCPGTPAGVKVDQDGCPPPVAQKAVPQAVKPMEAAVVPQAAKPMEAAIVPQAAKPMEAAIVPQAASSAMEAAIVEKGKVTLNVEFDFDKSVVKKKYYEKIAKLAVVMKKYPDLKIPLEGHTDNVGGLAYNEKLSQRRAGAVKKYLVEKLGIEASRLNAKGYGKIRPIASNATKEGRQKNRRVDAAAEFSIKK